MKKLGPLLLVVLCTLMLSCTKDDSSENPYDYLDKKYFVSNALQAKIRVETATKVALCSNDSKADFSDPSQF